MVKHIQRAKYKFHDFCFSRCMGKKIRDIVRLPIIAHEYNSQISIYLQAERMQLAILIAAILDNVAPLAWTTLEAIMPLISMQNTYISEYRHSRHSLISS